MLESDFSNALAQPADAVSFNLGASLRKSFPDSFILESESTWFRPFDFARDGQCAMKDAPKLHTEWNWEWDNEHREAFRQALNTCVSLTWKKHAFNLVTIGTAGRFGRETRHYLIAKTQAPAEAFFKAVCEWVGEIKSEILIFQDGHWQKSEQLYSGIKSASLDALVLPGKMREIIIDDFEKFFDGKETYANYRIAWKRGILFIGPPGNGKTHMVKAAVNHLGRPCLYVRGFNSPEHTPHHNIAQVFKRARDSAPCILVLEDLDSLVDDTNRSFFLNEMDGFYTNEGILTLATTNHPEKLDPAILERPSRFDRKYTFNIPAFEERRRFVELYNEGLDEKIQLNPDTILRIAYNTKNFSYAYLKELFLSSMMDFMAEGTTGTFGGCMLCQVENLRQQIKTTQIEEDDSLAA